MATKEGCEECHVFAATAGELLRRHWEIAMDPKFNTCVRHFLRADNRERMTLIHQAWVAHKLLDHVAYSRLRLALASTSSSSAKLALSLLLLASGS